MTKKEINKMVLKKFLKQTIVKEDENTTLIINTGREKEFKDCVIRLKDIFIAEESNIKEIYSGEMFAKAEKSIELFIDYCNKFFLKNDTYSGLSSESKIIKELIPFLLLMQDYISGR